MSKHWVFLVALSVTGIFFVNWCDVVFDCGCRSLWSGAATSCNVHRPVGPHCPWCAYPFLGGGIAFGSTIAAQWIVSYRTAMPPMARLGLAVLAFPVTSGLVALVQSWAWSY